MISRYYDKAALEVEVRAGRHRECVGGLWDEIGQLQLDFLVAQGLMPHHRLLDIGCGSLRGGVKLIRYLDAGHYAGVDLHESLLDAGYQIELAREGLTHKLPRSNLVADGEFDFSWCPMQVDFAAGAIRIYGAAAQLSPHLLGTAPDLRGSGRQILRFDL